MCNPSCCGKQHPNIVQMSDSKCIRNRKVVATKQGLWLFTLYINIKIGKIVVKCYTSRWPPVWDIAVHLAVACGVYGDVFLCCPFSHEVSWMRS